VSSQLGAGQVSGGRARLTVLARPRWPRARQAQQQVGPLRRRGDREPIRREPSDREPIHHEPSDRGTATVELAIAMTGILLAASIVLCVVGVGLVRLDVQDAARVGAREAITGAADSDVALAALRVAGAGATVHVARSGGWVTVTVERPLAGRWGGWTLQGRQEGKEERWEVTGGP